MGPQDKSQTNPTEERIAKGLGWFSIGLGLSELIAPGAMAGFIGVRNSAANRALLRIYGMREIAAGIGIFSQPRPLGWIWARIAGDTLDVGSLCAAAASKGSNGARLACSIASAAGVTALDLYCASRLNRLPESRGRDEQSHRASHSAVIIINRPADELYRRIREFMRMRGESGDSRMFTSGVEISEDPANQRLRWRAHPAARVAAGARFTITGNIRFEPAPADRGTIVRAELESPWNEGVARIAGKLIGIAGGELLENELRQFKQLVETGEIAVSEATAESGMHEAQPPRELVGA